MLVRLTLPGTTWRCPAIDMAFAEAVAGDGTTMAPIARTSVLTRIPRRRCIRPSLARSRLAASRADQPYRAIAYMHDPNPNARNAMADRMTMNPSHSRLPLIPPRVPPNQ